jgi:Type IV secretion system pilin
MKIIAKLVSTVLVSSFVAIVASTTFAGHVSAAGNVDIFNSCKNASTASCVDLCKEAPESTVCKARAEGNSNPLLGPTGIMTRVAQFIVWLTGIVSVFMIITNGIRYTTSNGDSASVSAAKNAIIYALVGLIFAIIAQGIVSFVLTKV